MNGLLAFQASASYPDRVPRLARHSPVTGKLGPHEHETPAQSLWVGLRYRLGDGDRPDRKASVSDEQLLQRQPDLPRRLVDWDRAVIACVCSDAISRQEEDKDDPPPEQSRSTSEDIRRASVAPTSTARPAQRTSAVIQRAEA
jgi:hypothetical protein